MPMSNPNMEALAEGHYAWCDPAYFDDDQEEEEDDESDSEEDKVER